MAEETLTNQENGGKDFEEEIRSRLKSLSLCGNVLHTIRLKSIEELDLLDAFAMNQVCRELQQAMSKELAALLPDQRGYDLNSILTRCILFCGMLSDFIQNFLSINKNLYSKNGVHKYQGSSTVILNYIIEDLLQCLALLTLDEPEDMGGEAC